MIDIILLISVCCALIIPLLILYYFSRKWDKEEESEHEEFQEYLDNENAKLDNTPAIVVDNTFLTFDKLNEIKNLFNSSVLLQNRFKMIEHFYNYLINSKDSEITEINDCGNILNITIINPVIFPRKEIRDISFKVSIECYRHIRSCSIAISNGEGFTISVENSNNKNILKSITGIVDGYHDESSDLRVKANKKDKSIYNEYTKILYGKN